MAIDGSEINASAINGVSDNTFSIFTVGFDSVLFDGVVVFKDLNLPADFYRPADLDYVEDDELLDFEPPLLSNEP